MNSESHFLGRQVEYPTQYNPFLLQAFPRRPNRESVGISLPDSLFAGVDSWHAYEAGFLTEKGLPVVGILKLTYPSGSLFLIESKSLKLYLNSLNMTPLGATPEAGIERYLQMVRTDLSQALAVPVEAAFFPQEPAGSPFDFEGYALLESDPRMEVASFADYTEQPALLRQGILPGGEIRTGSRLLRSNCKITGQPDWGTVYIRLKAEELPAPEALLRYLVSFRNENHFHEEVCEMVFKRLHDAFAPEILSVTCLYTRRGGIDICPSRANRPEYLPRCLKEATTLTRRDFRQ